ncbi:MAG: acylneuraminate cytidylyltransferase family protein [Pseudomonadota bacterium]|nr:acylneuraminate cytidylyltransferase family protein [Pseudomonadota bacterium]
MRKLSVVVPARSGSKRLAGKNVRPLAGEPLMFHTLRACLGHDDVEHVIFTSDSQEYLDLVDSAFGDAVKCVLRPTETAADTAKVTDEIRRLLNASPELFPRGWFGVCLPTAPLRTQIVMSRALAQWQTEGSALFSARPYDFPVQFAFRVSQSGDWEPVFGDSSPMVTGQTRSQDIETLYRPNGAIYIQRIDAFLRTGTFYSGAIPFLMSIEESLDVDTDLDFNMAELVLGRMQ